MNHARVLSAIVLVFIPASAARAQERDLRDQYGTRSLEGARQISRAIELAQARKPKEALAAIEAAIKADGKCQMAYYWKANILADLGDVAESIEASKKCLSDDVARKPGLSANAAVNLAITLGKLKEFDESNLWFTRAILEDVNNAAGQRGKAYRNLAVNLRAQGRQLAAALAVALAYQDKAPNVDPRMVRDFFAKAEGEEVARLLHFHEVPPKLEPRTGETKLTPVALEKIISEPVADFLTDPLGRYVIALPANSSHYYLISTEDQPSVRKVAVQQPLLCACLTEGNLYAVSNNPAKIEKIDVTTGQATQSYALKSYLPSSLAVFPSQSSAYFAAGRMLHQLNLKTGGISPTDIPGEVVAGHPNQRFLYSYLKPERKGTGGGHIIVNGRPIFFQTRQFDWLQTTLFKSVVVPAGLLIAEVRDNAASNASRMSLSPDGSWVAVAGGGGWRPAVPQGEAGYGVAVFAASDLERLRGFFKTDAYPAGVSFNPVTGQVAVLRSADVKVYHLADTKASVELKGAFTGPSAWSGNGRYLLLANNGGGVSVYENALSLPEKKLASNWWKNITVSPVAPPPVVSTASFQPVEAYTRFEITAPSREELANLFAQAQSSGRTDQPGAWQEYAPYTKEEGLRLTIQSASAQLRQKEDIGIAIFQLKKALKTHPESVPLQFFLAEGLRAGNQSEEAEKLFLAVVRADAGRTELSCLALNNLAALLAAKDQGLSALQCVATSLYLDKANPRTLALAIPLLKKHQFHAQAEQFAKLAATAPAPSSADLPKLSELGASKKYSAADLYRKAVWSVVLIKTANGSGSGVCVGKPDIILTNDHVVEPAGAIEVFPFILKEKTAVRMPPIRASVLYRSPKADIAVLKLDKAPDHLEPLAVATANPSPGEKVYAIGSPGLGTEILEQSISEGLVSSNNRLIDGVSYLQHSAAVNPGNSGGPLVDEECRLVGIVTLKARLENVSFAVPVDTVRAIFKSR